MERNIAQIRSLEQQLIRGLIESNVRFVRNGGHNTLPGLVSLSFPGFDGEAILHRMDLQGIEISTGSACDGQNTEISHVLKAIQLDEAYARGTVRISLGDYNNEDDVIAIVVNTFGKNVTDTFFILCKYYCGLPRHLTTIWRLQPQFNDYPHVFTITGTIWRLPPRIYDYNNRRRNQKRKKW